MRHDKIGGIPMDVKKINTELQSFWDGFFKQYQAQTIQKEDVQVENDLDLYIKEVGDGCHNVLDFGCGSGYAILTARLLGSRMQKGLAFDPSKVAIETLNKTLELSKIEGIETLVASHEDLSSYQDSTFDGVLCSNVLDVVPLDTSTAMIEEIDRLLKPGGLLMLKLNFLLTEDIITRTKAEEIAPNTYTINGVLRSYNLSTEDWIKRFKNFKVLKQATYERIKNGPLDRVLLLEKTK